MQVNTTNKDYWNNLYAQDDIGWDIGFPTPPIKAYVDQLVNKNLAILIPGCGNAYEAEYLLSQGFTDITLIDIAPLLTAALEKKFTEELGKRIEIITGDFFTHNGTYQLVIEQTFLSALNPALRPQYVEKMHSLLVKGGHLAGVLFSHVFEEEGPPFGGTLHDYQQMFSQRFTCKKIEPCYNSIERRKGSEVFINLIAK